MAHHIHTIIGYIHALRTQPRPLFISRGSPQRQAQTTAGTQYTVPRQTGVRRKLAEGLSNPTRRSAKARQFGELAVADHLACWHLAQH
ncbi:hypothetical protein BR1R5_48870 [Pseudomonas sp. BR1R-5]|nr:hypothetical protein BR1R5_48870 [Pseudomonas sp. BR1R-5]